MPLPWQLWPAEARLLVGLAAFWSVAGLVVLASASWWVALREMGDGAFYVKRQTIWLLASWSLLGLTVSIDLRRLLKWAGPGLWMGCILIAATLGDGHHREWSQPLAGGGPAADSALRTGETLCGAAGRQPVCPMDTDEHRSKVALAGRASGGCCC
jgi:hypothetical protein